MFWGKEKKIKVELINPRLVIESPSLMLVHEEAERVAVQAPDSGRPSIDVLLKVAAFAAAVVNGTLIIFGYMGYLALLELYGIERSEVSFSIADLLVFGYGKTLNLALSTQLSQACFGVLAGFAGLGVVALLWRNSSGWKQVLLAWVLGCVIAFVPSVPIWIGYIPAKRSLLTSAAKRFGVDADKLDGLTKRTDVLTTDGFVEGDILLATNDFTYLLKDKVLYKIRQADGVVVRKTYLSEVMKVDKPN